MPFYAEIVKATTPSGAAGWILEEGGERGVHVAPWMIKKEKEALFCSIVGFLKSGTKGLREAELWSDQCWGKMPIRLQLLKDQIVWIQLSSEKEVDEVLQNAAEDSAPSPFLAVECSMEFLGPPPHPTWVLMKGVPLHT